MSEDTTRIIEIGPVENPQNAVLVEEMLGPLGSPTADPPKTRDDPKEPTRQNIVYMLLAIMGGLILLPFVMTAFFGCKDEAKECKDIMTKELWEFVHIAFPALTGLLGTAIGFYFERNSK